MKKFFQHYTPLQIAIHIYAWSEIVILILDFFTRHLTANPIQALEQRTGRHALTLLVLTLACTPLNTLFKWSEVLKRRRALGLYTFMYATVHVIIFIDLDYGLAWKYIFKTVIEKPYIILGAAGFLLLIPLAWTSFDIWKKRLGMGWKWLHKTVYLIALLIPLHYALSLKGNIFTLQGDIVRPLIYGLIVILFLIFRIPAVRRFIASLRDRVLYLLRRRTIQAEIPPQ